MFMANVYVLEISKIDVEKKSVETVFFLPLVYFLKQHS